MVYQFIMSLAFWPYQTVNSVASLHQKRLNLWASYRVIELNNLPLLIENKK
jgi:hypothetical protein